MIIVTGGCGFIGSALVWQLNQSGITDIVVVDEFGTDDKWKNLVSSQVSRLLNKEDLFEFLSTENPQVDCVFHMGACSSTDEKDMGYLIANNVEYSIQLARYCQAYEVPFVYASSAATYGDGSQGFDDDIKTLRKLVPLNRYGYSKQLFDCWMLDNQQKGHFWCGLKFFNVYGPNEYHKLKQASVAYHAYHQIKDTKQMRLFKSYKPDIPHGEQKRDFVYVKDVARIMTHILKNHKELPSGIYNVGSGKAQSFCELANALFAALNLPETKIEWIDMPPTIKEHYQYFTEASIERLRSQLGYQETLSDVASGVRDYVCQYLEQTHHYL